MIYNVIVLSVLQFQVFIECFTRFCNHPLCSINSNPSTCWMFNYTCLFCTNTTKCSLIHRFEMGYVLFEWTQQFSSSIDRPHFCITNVHVITTIFSSSIRKHLLVWFFFVFGFPFKWSKREVKGTFHDIFAFLNEHVLPQMPSLSISFYYLLKAHY
jgi:hypothetical protein